MMSIVNIFAKIDFNGFFGTLSVVEAYDFNGLENPSTSLRGPILKLAKVLIVGMVLKTPSSLRRCFRFYVGASLVFAIGCSSSGDSKSSAMADTQETIIFPENYQATYTLIRGCRPSTVHAGLGGITVYINSESLNAFKQLWSTPSTATQLPLDTVLVKEVYGDTSDCSGSITEWAVMKKEKEGYASDAGNWNWQTVNTKREIVNNESGIVASCIQCHQGISICDGYGQKTGYDYTCTEPLSTDPAF